MGELDQQAIERALRRALASFVAGYGSTTFRGLLSPNTGTFDPTTGATGGGMVCLEFPTACNPEVKDKSYTLVVNADYGLQEEIGQDTDTIEDAFLQYEWGDIGHVAQVDLRRGHPVALAGQKVIVRAFYPRVVTKAPETTQPDILLRITIGVGSENGAPGITGSATRTIRYGVVPAAGEAGPGLSQILAIPPWAVAAVLVNPEANVVSLVYTQFLDAQGTNPVSQVDLGKQNNISVPIANGARFARVSNPGNAPHTARILYFLAIGA